MANNKKRHRRAALIKNIKTTPQILHGSWLTTFAPAIARIH